MTIRTLVEANREARKYGAIIRRNKSGGIEMKRFGMHICWARQPMIYDRLDDAVSAAKANFDAAVQHYADMWVAALYPNPTTQQSPKQGG